VSKTADELDECQEIRQTNHRIERNVGGRHDRRRSGPQQRTPGRTAAV